MSKPLPFANLFLARLREFIREPEVVFWVFGFPLLLAMGLGLAFRNKPPDAVVVGVIQNSASAPITAALKAADGIVVHDLDETSSAGELRLGKVAIIVVPGDVYEYRYDPTRPDSIFAREKVDDALQRAAGRADSVRITEVFISEPGARYIDFLIPGLLGMNIMSGGMWGVGFVLVDMRARKLLKRLVATPMPRSHFMASLMASRMLLVFLEMVLLLIFGWLVFDMVILGSLGTILILALVGSFVFAGIGLLTGSRTQKIETVSGLMNLIMLPMFVFSGIFFSADRFPDVIQPFIRALPLTALNDSLRASILDGATLVSQTGRISVMLIWGIVAFVAAIKIFKWN
jgi:ABC-2 type transport system permease protein